MQVRSPRSRLAARSATLTLCAAVAIPLSLTAASKRPIKKLSFDPSAPAVELFDGIDQGTLSSTVIMKNSFKGTVFLENTTNKPLTVKLPKAVAAVQVLKQGYGGGGGGGFGGGGGGLGGGGGGSQGIGGGLGGGGGGLGGGGMGGGGGMFSIPPEKVVQLPMTSVCLEHGKPDPKPKMTYKLVPANVFTSDPVLQELLAMIGNGSVDQTAGQAAAWHLSDHMSWDDLGAKKIEHLGGLPSEPYFKNSQLQAARELVAEAKARARERESESNASEKPAVSKNRRPEKKI